MKSIDCLVLFGATGNLARKKLFPALYRLEERGALHQSILGVARDEWDTETFKGHVSSAVTAAVPEFDPKVVSTLLNRLDYVAGVYEDPATYAALAELIGPGKPSLIYMAIPPDLFQTVVKGLNTAGLASQSRFLVEKPFGRDLESASELNTFLHSYLNESEIYRIDHYLGKESVENLLAFRYANPMFDVVWNRDCIDHIQVTMAESFGIEDRGGLYETLGVIRDVVQNHLLQVVCLLTMDAPKTPDAEAFADARANVLKAIGTIGRDDVVYGQYDGYRSIDSVANDSLVPTFAALSLHVDLPRWHHVPIYIRAGKSMKCTATQAVVVFRQAAPLSFSTRHATPAPNQLAFRIGPRDGVDLYIQTKVPGDGMSLATTPLRVHYDELFDRIPLAYEHVLHNALIGDQTQFAREDAVEESWRVVSEIVDTATAPASYVQGTWGPEESRDILGAGRHWIDQS